MIIKCASCFKDIYSENDESLCPECFEYLCGTKVSWEDYPDEEIYNEEEKVHEKNGTKGSFQTKNAGTI